MYLKDTHLDEQEEVGILALGSGTLALLDVVARNVDTLAFPTMSTKCSTQPTTTSSPSCSCRKMCLGLLVQCIVQNILLMLYSLVLLKLKLRLNHSRLDRFPSRAQVPFFEKITDESMLERVTNHYLLRMEFLKTIYPIFRVLWALVDLFVGAYEQTDANSF